MNDSLSAVFACSVAKVLVQVYLKFGVHVDRLSMGIKPSQAVCEAG